MRGVREGGTSHSPSIPSVKQRFSQRRTVSWLEQTTSVMAADVRAALREQDYLGATLQGHIADVAVLLVQVGGLLRAECGGFG